MKFRERYYLFAPEFVKRQDQKKTESGTAKTASEAPMTQLSAPVLYEIKVGVSEFFHGKWGKKNYMSVKGNWALFSNLVTSNISEYVFNININKDAAGNDDSLALNLFDAYNNLLTMTFYSVNSAMVLSPNKETKSPHSGFYQNIELSKWQFRVPDGDDDNFIDILKKNDSELHLSFSPQYSATPDINLNFDQPFFLSDHHRTYYVSSEPFIYVPPKSGSGFTVKQTKYPLLVGALKEPAQSPFLAFHIANPKP